MTSLENGSLMNGKVHVTWLVSSMCDDDGLCRVVGAIPLLKSLLGLLNLSYLPFSTMFHLT